MSTGRICPKCFCDVVAVCGCRTTNGTISQRKRAREVVESRSPPPLLSPTTPTDIQGRSVALEKMYTRPATAPCMDDVRSETILQKAFDKVLQSDNLEYIADQLKAIRQDLTIQRIETALTAAVFETYTRLAVKLHQIEQIGQCLNAVRSLHKGNVFGKAITTQHNFLLPSNCGVQIEFVVFRILYTGLATKHEDAVAWELQGLPKEQWEHHLVKFAIKVVGAKFNPSLFTELLRNASSFGCVIANFLHIFIPRLRLDWMRTIVESHRDSITEDRLAILFGLRSVSQVKPLMQQIIPHFDGVLHCAADRDRIIAYLNELLKHRH